MPNQNAQENAKEPLVNVDNQVRDTEDASLQDDTYSFDEDNTANEEYHDVDELDEETDLTDIFESDDDLQ